MCLSTCNRQSLEDSKQDRARLTRALFKSQPWLAIAFVALILLTLVAPSQASASCGFNWNTPATGVPGLFYAGGPRSQLMGLPSSPYRMEISTSGDFTPDFSLAWEGQDSNLYSIGDQYTLLGSGPIQVQVTHFQIPRGVLQNEQATIHMRLYNLLGALVCTSDLPVIAEFPTPGPNDVRLRHDMTGNCMFGAFQNHQPARNWLCWDDPNMAFTLLPIAGGNQFRVRHLASDRCVASGANDGAVVTMQHCSTLPGLVFEKEAVGNNEFRLRNVATGQCLYGVPEDGGMVRSWTCWNDPNMVWTELPY